MSAARIIISEYFIENDGGKVTVYKEGDTYSLEAVDEFNVIFLRSKNISTLRAAENRAEEMALLLE
jgi:hypothetical protein